jgi:hypothetical protein
MHLVTNILKARALRLVLTLTAGALLGGTAAYDSGYATPLSSEAAIAKAIGASRDFVDRDGFLTEVAHVIVGGVARGGWVRPRRYWWPVGGAIAAGAAVGFVTAAAAASWAGAPPAPGYCWYYTDPSRQQGFWDACPQ